MSFRSKKMTEGTEPEEVGNESVSEPRLVIPYELLVSYRVVSTASD